MANKSLKAWTEQEGAEICSVVAIRELLQNRNVILLEGQDDDEYIGKFLNDKTKCQIAGNKSRVIKTLGLIANKKERKLIGVSDRDYEVNRHYPDNLFFCDHRDVEMMVISSEGIAERVFEGNTVLKKKLAKKRLHADFLYSLNDFKADIESVIRSLVPVSLFFILHDRNGMKTPYRDCLDGLQSVLTETTESIKGKIAKYISETLTLSDITILCLRRIITTMTSRGDILL